MSASISSIVDNGDGTATLTWANAVGTVSVRRLTPPATSFTVVGTASTASGTATFTASPGLNWAYLVDVSGLNAYTYGPVMFTMNTDSGALEMTAVGVSATPTAVISANDVRQLKVDFSSILGDAEIISGVTASCATMTVAGAAVLLAATTINDVAVISGQSVIMTISGAAAGFTNVINVTVTTSGGQTINCDITVISV